MKGDLYIESNGRKTQQAGGKNRYRYQYVTGKNTTIACLEKNTSSWFVGEKGGQQLASTLNMSIISEN